MAESKFIAVDGIRTHYLEAGLVPWPNYWCGGQQMNSMLPAISSADST